MEAISRVNKSILRMGVNIGDSTSSVVVCCHHTRKQTIKEVASQIKAQISKRYLNFTDHEV